MTTELMNSATSVIQNAVTSTESMKTTPAQHSSALLQTANDFNGSVPWYLAMPGDIHTIIHDHWKQFDMDDISPTWFHAVGIFISFAGTIGVLGNLLVVYIFGTTKSLRTPSNMLIINLAVSDLTFSVVNGFPLMSISSFQRRWIWGATICQLYGFVGGLFGLMSINTLAFIAYDRYFVISDPFAASTKLSHKRSFSYIAMVWAWSITWSIPPFFGWGAYRPDGFHVSCTYDYVTRDINNITFNFGMHMCAFLMPVILIVYCYVNIVRSVYKQADDVRKMGDRMGAKVGKGENERKQEIKTAKIVAMTVFMFLVSWVPYASIGLCGLLGKTDLVTPFTAEIPVIFAKASAMYNPIIYALSHPRYRAELAKRFPWMGCLVSSPKRQASQNSNISRATKNTMSMSSTTSDSHIEVVGEKVEKAPPSEGVSNPAYTP